MSSILRKVLTSTLGLSIAVGGVTPVLLSQPAFAQSRSDFDSMTLERLEAILQSEAEDVQGGAGQWQVTLNGRTLLVLANLPSNRMRIFTPVISTAQLAPEQIQNILVANFHTALDARYAVTEDTVVSLFVHPLESLQSSDLRSGLRQVANLADTFGSSYTSGELLFDQNAPTSPTPGVEVEVRNPLLDPELEGPNRKQPRLAST